MSRNTTEGHYVMIGKRYLRDARMHWEHLSLARVAVPDARLGSREEALKIAGKLRQKYPDLKKIGIRSIVTTDEPYN